MPDGDDEDDIEPAGDLDLLEDLGVSPLLMAELCDDLELYPDDVFGQLAEHMGFCRAVRRRHATRRLTPRTA